MNITHNPAICQVMYSIKLYLKSPDFRILYFEIYLIITDGIPYRIERKPDFTLFFIYF